jgi:2-polyprenyl-6-methoxyphenol hydroxylase-like FAD-dependent oxidoreductase
VLIVGAGPTGLTAAVELARRDVTVRIIDRSPTPSTETKALGVQARTLELLDRLGIAERAVSRGLPVRRFNIFSEHPPHRLVRSWHTAHSIPVHPHAPAERDRGPAG